MARCLIHTEPARIEGDALSADRTGKSVALFYLLNLRPKEVRILV